MLGAAANTNDIGEIFDVMDTDGDGAICADDLAKVHSIYKYGGFLWNSSMSPLKPLRKEVPLSSGILTSREVLVKVSLYAGDAEDGDETLSSGR